VGVTVMHDGYFTLPLIPSHQGRGEHLDRGQPSNDQIEVRGGVAHGQCMLNKLSSLIARRYSLRLMITLFFAVAFFFWLFNFSTLPLSNPELKRIGNGGELLDTRSYYSAQEAFQAMERYGAEGRALYRRFLAADFIFAPTYGLAFALLFTRLAIALFGPSSSWVRLNVLPIGIAVADVAENIGIFLLLQTYPAQHIVLGSLAGIATLVKWTLTVVALVFLALAVLLLVKRLGSSRG